MRRFAASRNAWYPLYRSFRPTNRTVAGSIGTSGSQLMIGPTPVTWTWRTRRDAYQSASHLVRAITASSRRYRAMSPADVPENRCPGCTSGVSTKAAPAARA